MHDDVDALIEAALADSDASDDDLGAGGLAASGPRADSDRVTTVADVRALLKTAPAPLLLPLHVSPHVAAVGASAGESSVAGRERSTSVAAVGRLEPHDARNDAHSKPVGSSAVASNVDVAVRRRSASTVTAAVGDPTPTQQPAATARSIPPALARAVTASPATVRRDALLHENEAPAPIAERVQVTACAAAATQHRSMAPQADDDVDLMDLEAILGRYGGMDEAENYDDVGDGNDPRVAGHAGVTGRNTPARNDGALIARAEAIVDALLGHSVAHPVDVIVGHGEPAGVGSAEIRVPADERLSARPDATRADASEAVDGGTYSPATIPSSSAAVTATADAAASLAPPDATVIPIRASLDRLPAAATAELDLLVPGAMPEASPLEPFRRRFRRRALRQAQGPQGRSRRRVGVRAASGSLGGDEDAGDFVNGDDAVSPPQTARSGDDDNDADRARDGEGDAARSLLPAAAGASAPSRPLAPLEGRVTGPLVLRNGAAVPTFSTAFAVGGADGARVSSSALGAVAAALGAPLPPPRALPIFESGGHAPAGVLAVEALARISEALHTYASAPPAECPGRPTALAVAPKFVVIGTSRSLLLLFDHFGELRSIAARVQLPTPPSAGGASAIITAALVALASATAGAAGGGGDGPVTAIDAATGGDYVVAGFMSGRTALIDAGNLTRPAVLRATEGGSGRAMAPLTSVRLLAPATAETMPPVRVLAIDASGGVAFLTFSSPRLLGLMSLRSAWSVEARVVLDGSQVGQITSVAVLPPPSPTTPMLWSGGDAGGGSSSGTLFAAFSTSGSGSDDAGGLAHGLAAAAAAAASAAFAAPPLPNVGSLVALCTRDATFILSTTPEVRVLHRWPRPLDVPPNSGVLPAVAWARARVAGSAVFEDASDRRTAASLADIAIAAGSAAAGEAAVTAALRTIGIGGTSASSASVGAGRAAGGRAGSFSGSAAGGTPNPGPAATADSGGARSRSASVASTDAGFADVKDRRRGSVGGADDGLTIPQDAETLKRAASGQTQRPPRSAAAVSKQRGGSTLAPSVAGIVTAVAAPVLARAWGHRLQLLQIAPAGGYPIELTNLANGSHPQHGAVRPAPPPLPTASPTSTSLLDFILADDVMSPAPIAALAWVASGDAPLPLLPGAPPTPQPPQLLYMTGDAAARLVLLDTATMEERDAISLENSRQVWAAMPPPATAAPNPPTSTQAADQSAMAYASYAAGHAVCDGRMYVLCAESLLSARIRPWTERCGAAVDAGDWLPALALALDVALDAVAGASAAIDRAEAAARTAALRAAELVGIAAAGGTNVSSLLPSGSGLVSGASSSAANAAAAAAAAIYDPSRFARMRNAPGPLTPRTPVGDAAERLVLNFVRARLAALPVVASAKAAAATLFADVSGDSVAALELQALRRAPSAQTMPPLPGLDAVASSHARAAAAVAIDFCLSIGRADVLFRDVYEAFAGADVSAALLEALEPFVLRGVLSALPPEIMKAAVAHGTSVGRLPVIERILLRLDLRALDVDAAVRLCLRARLFSALSHVLATGLRDTALPIDIMLAAATDGSRGSTATAETQLITRRRASSAADEAGDGNDTALPPFTVGERDALGSKLLLYLAFCLTGRHFPHGVRQLAARLEELRQAPLAQQRSNADLSNVAAAASARGIDPLVQTPQLSDAAVAMAMVAANALATTGSLPGPGGSSGSGSELAPLLPRGMYAPAVTLLVLAADPTLAAVMAADPASPLLAGSPLRPSAVVNASLVRSPSGAEVDVLSTQPPVPLEVVFGAELGALVATTLTSLRVDGGQQLQLQAASKQRRPRARPLAGAVTASAGRPLAIVPRYGGGGNAGGASTRPPTGASLTSTGGPPQASSRRRGAIAASGRHLSQPQAAVPAAAASQQPPQLQFDPTATPPRSLRADTLATLLERAPAPFPAVSRSMLAAGGLVPGAAAARDIYGRGPFPRLQALLAIDAIAATALLGRIYTPAADAMLLATWLAEGAAGLVRRCMLPPPDGPAAAVPPISAPDISSYLAEARGGAGAEGGPNAALVDAGPSLAALTSALLAAAVTLVPVDALAVAPSWVLIAGQRRSGGGTPSATPAASATSAVASRWAPLAGRTVPGIADNDRASLAPSFGASQAAGLAAAVTAAVAAVPPTLAIVLLFAAAQAGRLGPGIPPLFHLRRDLLQQLMGDDDDEGATSAGTSGAFVAQRAWLRRHAATEAALLLIAAPCTASQSSPLVLSNAMLCHLLHAWGARTDEAIFGPVTTARETLLHTYHGDGNGTCPFNSAMYVSAREALLVRLLRTTALPREHYEGLRDMLAALVAPVNAASRQPVVGSAFPVATMTIHALLGDAVAAFSALIELRRGKAGYACSFEALRMWLQVCGVPRVSRLAAPTNAPTESWHDTIVLGTAFDVASLVDTDEGEARNAAKEAASLVHLVRRGVAIAHSTDTATMDVECADATNYGSGVLSSYPMPTPLPRSLGDIELRVLRDALVAGGGNSSTLLARLARSDSYATAAVLADLFAPHPRELPPQALTAVLEQLPEVAFSYYGTLLRRLGAIQALDDASSGGVYTWASDVEEELGTAGSGTPLPGTIAASVAVPAELHLRYCSLLCRFKPRAVTQYLVAAAAWGASSGGSSGSGYPLDATLAIVKNGQYRVPEAAAYLLERTGDAAGALALTLSGCDAALRSLHTAVLRCAVNAAAEASQARTHTQSSQHEVITPQALLRQCEVEADAVINAFTCAVALCARNSARFGGNSVGDDGTAPVAASVGSLATRGGVQSTGADAWFDLLDRVLFAQAAVQATGSPPAPGATGGRGAAAAAATARAAAAARGATESIAAEDTPRGAAARALLVALGDCLRSVLEGMRGTGGVPLHTVLRKVLADHGGAALGEFRATLLSLLGAHSYERRMLGAATALMARDIMAAVRALRRGHTSALPPPRAGSGGASGGACSTCGGILGRPPPSSTLAVATRRESTLDSTGDNTAAYDINSENAVTGFSNPAGLALFFGCGHAYHDACLLHHGDPHCPLCDAARTATTHESGVTVSQLRSSPRRFLKREAADNRLEHLSDAGDHSLSGAVGTVTAIADNDNDTDAHAARLERARDAHRRGTRPLSELYVELSSAPTTLQVRNVALRTAPPRPQGTSSSNAAATFRIRRRDPSLRNKREMEASCTVASL